MRAIALALATRAVALGAAFAAAAAPASRADGADACVSPRGSLPQAIEAIRLEPIGWPRELAGVIARAISYWNRPSCNRGHDFPVLAFATDAPHRVLRVRWIAGVNPGSPGVCGSFVGSDVTLYARVLDPWTGKLSDCGDAERIAETLAHELGHALGLEDQYAPACAGHIMGQLVRTRTGEALPRQVQAAECAAVDAAFRTELEQRLEALPADRVAADGGDGGLNPPSSAAPDRPRSARTGRGSPETGSAVYRP